DHRHPGPPPLPAVPRLPRHPGCSSAGDADRGVIDMGQRLVIAFRNLVQHSRRTALLGGAILGVTALLVLLVGLLNGIRSTMLESATTLMSGHVNVGGFYKVTAGQSAPV